jgi:hypothetical protein
MVTLTEARGGAWVAVVRNSLVIVGGFANGAALGSVDRATLK